MTEPKVLVVGDTMIVKPGERLATDGTISSGHTALDTSAITGSRGGLGWYARS